MVNSVLVFILCYKYIYIFAYYKLCEFKNNYLIFNIYHKCIFHLKMFKGKTFAVIEYSIDLAAKRKKVLTDIIKKNKGEIIDKEESNSISI